MRFGKIFIVFLTFALFISSSLLCVAQSDEKYSYDFENPYIDWTAYNQYGQDFSALQFESYDVNSGYGAARLSKMYDGDYYIKSQGFYLNPSVDYCFGGWIKTQNAEGCRAYIVFEQQLTTGETITTATDSLVGTVGEYTKLSGKVTVDPYAYSVSVLVVFADDGTYYGGNAVLYADDIFVYEAPKAVAGDITGDGAVDSNDLAVLKKVLLGLEQKQPVYDIDSNGNTDILDMVKLKKYIAKLY